MRWMMYRWWCEGGGDRAWWVIERVFLRSPDKGFWACLGDIPQTCPDSRRLEFRCASARISKKTFKLFCTVDKKKFDRYTGSKILLTEEDNNTERKSNQKKFLSLINSMQKDCPGCCPIAQPGRHFQRRLRQSQNIKQTIHFCVHSRTHAKQRTQLLSVYDSNWHFYSWR